MEKQLLTFLQARICTSSLKLSLVDLIWLVIGWQTRPSFCKSFEKLLNYLKSPGYWRQTCFSPSFHNPDCVTSLFDPSPYSQCFVSSENSFRWNFCFATFHFNVLSVIYHNGEHLISSHPMLVRFWSFNRYFTYTTTHLNQNTPLDANSNSQAPRLSPVQVWVACFICISSMFQ